MKKTLIIIAVIITIICINKNETLIIPKEAIRFRIIANSDSSHDQIVKKKILNNLKEEINNLKFNDNIDYARKNIQNKIPNFKQNINQIIEKENIEYTIEYGKNHFPRKEYKGVIYEEGDYESLIITLGKGKGENFWCVLFPPLCVIDEEINTRKDVKYTSIVSEIIDKYFK